MPKQIKTYSRFEGGLSTKTNTRSILDNELSVANNVIVDDFGIVESFSKFADNDTDYNGSISITAAQPGYGLFQGRFDYIDATNTSTIKTFLADADASGNVNINIADGNGSFDNTPNSDGTALTLGAVTGSGSNDQGRVIYHVADGVVRICDTNISNTSTSIKKYGHIKFVAKWLDSSGSGQSPGDSGYYNDIKKNWIMSDTKLSPPTRGIVGSTITGTTDSSGNSDNTLVPSSALLAAHETQLDVNNDHYAVSFSSLSVEYDTILEFNTTTNLTTTNSSSNWSISNGQGYGIFPPAGKGFNLQVTASGSDGSFSAGDYEFATTFIYDDNQESLPFILDGHLGSVSANNQIDCTVLLTERETASELFDPRITGGRIYIREKDTDDPLILFGEINFRNGTKPSIDGVFTSWTHHAGLANSPFMQSSFTSLGLNADTYESLNGFSQDSAFISIGENGEKYQTSVVSNRRVFIGNVKYINNRGQLENRGDTIRYSEINKFDTFPELNFLDIGVNDGEEFIKLEAYADRLLAYKEKTLYIINVGGGSDTQWFLESTQSNMGVNFHAAVAKTEFGICWVNKNGLYLYDGSRISNLQNKILESEWKEFITSDSMLGYEPTHKHLIVIKSASASTSGGDAYIYSFVSNSFTKADDITTQSIKTNPITDLHNNLSIGLGTDEIFSYDGEPVANNSFEVKLKNDDFGLPGVVKKVYAVTVEHANGAAHTDGVRMFFTTAAGVSTESTSSDFVVGTLPDTSNLFFVTRLTNNLPVECSSFQVHLDLNGSTISKIKNVSVEYRPIYKKVT